MALPPFSGVNRRSEDAINFGDGDPVKFCDLHRRHAVSRQCTDAADLRRRHGAGYLFGYDPSPYWLYWDWRFHFWARREPRRGGENTWLTPRFLLVCRSAILHRSSRLGIGVGPRRFEQVFSCLSRPADLFSTIPLVR
jgi:hypothetical protein